MADSTVESFLKKRKGKGKSNASTAPSDEPETKPILQMKKYSVPVKSAGTDSTENSQDGIRAAGLANRPV